MAATQKQLDYRNSLTAKKIENLVGGYDNRKLMEAVLAVNLSEPTDKAQASAQIDALKGSMKGYCQANPEWFQELAGWAESNEQKIKQAIRDAHDEIDLYGAIRKALSR